MDSILIVGLGANKPSTRLRMLPLAEHLRQHGHAVTLLDVPRSLAGKLKLLKRASSHDVVVLQKKLFPTPYVSLLRRANAKLIFDVDDAVMFHELERGEPVNGEFFKRFAAIVSASHAVVAGNRFVAEFASAARGVSRCDGVSVLPTPIDTHNLIAKTDYRHSDNIVIGWIGTKGNLYQLQPLAPVLRKLQDLLPGMRLRIIADATIDIPGVTIETKPWRASEETDDLHGFDIGIMPLEDTLWNRGKGGYKLLQYMAAGLPAVASPVGINADIVRPGINGFLAGDEAGWLDSLLMLARQHELRQRIGQAARKAVEQSFSLDRYLKRYAEILENCLR